MNCLLPIISLCVFSVSASAAVIVYENDFSTPIGSGYGFSESSDAQWSVGSGVYINTITGDSASAANLSLPSVPGNNFIVTTVFTVPTIPASGNFSVGFSALSNSGTTDFYLADISNSGTLRLGAFNTGTFSAFSGTTLSGTALGNLISGETYTMTLTGTYVGTSLTLALAVNDGANTATLTGTAPNAAKTGTYFGYRDRVNTAGEVGTIRFDQFSVTIPEPSSSLALGLGAMGGVLKRRRSRIE